MKNTGSILFLIFFILISSGLYAVEVETELSLSKIAVGESASLSIKITGKSSKVKPVKFPAIEGLQITFSGSSRSFQFVNGKTWSGTVLNFSIYGEKKGEYKIPSFILEADGENVASREVKLTVIESSASRIEGPIRGEVDLSSETVYIGEPFILRYFVDNGEGESPRVDRFIEQPHAKGFVMKELDEKLNVAGKTYAGSFCLIPLDKGVNEVGGGSVEVLIDMAEGFFTMNRRGGISFPLKRIRVIPIPADGKPDNFTGDVGEFKMEAEVPQGKFKLFEEIKIPVKISGRGNLLTLSKPKIANESGIKIIIEEKDLTLSANEVGLSGEKKFLITIIPQKEGNINPERIFIEFFNPYKKIYERVESSALTFEVQKDESTGEKGEIQFSSNGLSENRFNYFYAVIILLAVTVSVIALVMWERRKFRMIKAEFSPDTPDKDETLDVNIKDDILKNLQISVREKNAELFLLNADRGINQIDTLKLSPAELIKYDLFKGKVYSCRYGGGAFAEVEMSDLSEWLKRNLK